MINMIKSEHLKQKHSFQKILIWLAPTITLLLAFILMGGNYVQLGGYNWWYMLILPGSTALIASSIINNDSKKKFHCLFSVVINKDKIWYSKIMLCTIYLAISCLIFFLGGSIWGYLFKDTMSIKNSFFASVVLFVTYSWQIPLFMYISMKFNTGITIIISLICNFFIGAICAVTSIWWIPFAIPARLMCYIIGVKPNGLPVEDGTYIFNIKIILIALAITIILYMIISYLSAIWFKKQEV